MCLIWPAVALLAGLPFPTAADPSSLVNHGPVPPPNLSTAAQGACKDSANLRVAVDEWNAAHLSRTNSKTVQDMCGCLEVPVAKGKQAQFSKCTIPKELKNTQARALANACACFDQLMGIQRSTTTITTKPTSSSTWDHCQHILSATFYLLDELDISVNITKLLYSPSRFAESYISSPPTIPTSSRATITSATASSSSSSISSSPSRNSSAARPSSSSSSSSSSSPSNSATSNSSSDSSSSSSSQSESDSAITPSSSSTLSSTLTYSDATVTDSSTSSQSTSSSQASSTDSVSVTTSSDNATITDSGTSATTTVFPADAVGTVSEFDGPYTLPAAPTVTLVPAPPYGVDQGSLDVVTPATSNSLWYNSPADEANDITATIVGLTLTYQDPQSLPSPPASVICGLPAAPCGNDFDSALDATLGYYNADETDIDSVMAQIAPGTQTTLSIEASSLSSRRLAVRSRLLSNLLQRLFVTAVVKVAAKVTVAAVNFVAKAATAIAKTVVTIPKTYYNLAKFLFTGDYDQSFNLHMNMAPPDALMVKSPWDDQLGFKFYHFAVDPKDSGCSLWNNAIDLISDELGANAKTDPGVDFWCINCGIKGALKANLYGIKNAELQIRGNLYAGIFLGIDALATIKKKNTKTLPKQGLPGFSIPKVFTLGPSVSLGVSAEARIELIGRALAGASLNWENINGSINFLDKSKTVTSGFTPVLNGTLQTTKKSKLILSLGLPVAINFGVEILNGVPK
ncbi:putative PA14 domain-containing protein [Seiridium unicorne]|uniref:PA14 domain-containing protein n=1 Tax=Seiridium unicorne TaxID=138068 RepID=A0ABR2UN06_9PEZI